VTTYSDIDIDKLLRQKIKSVMFFEALDSVLCICVIHAGKHDIKKDRKGLSQELKDKKDAKSSAMSIQVSLSIYLHMSCMFMKISR